MATYPEDPLSAEEEDDVALPPSLAPLEDARSGGMGPLRAMSLGLPSLQDYMPQATMPPIPQSPVDPSAKWSAFAAGALRGRTFGANFANALGAYSGQQNKDAELYARYVPIAYDAKLRRAQAQFEMQQKQQALLASWDKALLSRAAPLLNEGAPISPESVIGAAKDAVAAGVPAKFAEEWLQRMPSDPVMLRAYLSQRALAATDPFRAIAKPEYQKVGADESLVQTNAPEGPQTVMQGKAKPTDFAKMIAEFKALPAGPEGDQQRNMYRQMFIKMMTHPPAASATIINPAKPLVQSLMEGLGPQLMGARQTAESAASQLGTINRLRAALDTGKTITGFGADERIVAKQLAQYLGIGGKDDAEVLANTRAAMQSLSQLELDAAAAMRGQGAITENERKLIAAAAGGKIALTEPELRKLTDALEKVARAKIARFNSSLGVIGKVRDHTGKTLEGSDTLIDMLSIQLPAQTEVYDEKGRLVEQR